MDWLEEIWENNKGSVIVVLVGLFLLVGWLAIGFTFGLWPFA